MSCIIDGEHDQVGELLHRFAADVFIPDGGGGRQIGDAVKILGHQVGEAVAHVGGDEVVYPEKMILFGGHTTGRWLQTLHSSFGLHGFSVTPRWEGRKSNLQNFKSYQHEQNYNTHHCPIYRIITKRQFQYNTILPEYVMQYSD